MAIPKYSVGDVIFLSASAQGRGFLESYKITGIIQTEQAGIIYTISLAPPPPQPRSVADRFDLKIPRRQLYFSEHELITLCEALPFIIAYHERLLIKYQNMSDERCDTGTDATGT